MYLTRFAVFAALSMSLAFAGDSPFKSVPSSTDMGTKCVLKFELAASADVEVSVLNSKKEVVRHLAAGVLGGKNAPPGPLQEGLSQVLEWDGNDDFGKRADDGPFSFRVRAGMGAKFGRTIGGDPYLFGELDSLATDEKGNVYVFGDRGLQNQHSKTLRVFSPEGKFLRTVMPFPANLAPGDMKDIAGWDESSRTFRPRQLKNLYPEFYVHGGENWNEAGFHIIAAGDGKVLLSEGRALYCLDDRGAVPGPSFAAAGFWEKTPLPNSGSGPIFLHKSIDGKYLFLSGPFSATTSYGHVANPAYPPGQIYRMEIGKGSMKPFAKIDLKGAFDKGTAYWGDPHNKLPNNFTLPHGPIHQVATDKEGNVLVADRDNQCIQVFDPDGKPAGKVDVNYPDLVAVNPRSGELYVLTKEITGYWKYAKKLLKFSGWKEAKLLASYEFAAEGHWPQMALSVCDKTVVWVSGVAGGLVSIEDKGTQLVPVKTSYAPSPGAEQYFTRIAVDSAREEVYVNDGMSGTWRYNGITGEGALLTKDGKPFDAADLAVGYDGLLYVRTGPSHEGPFARYTRDLAPAPYKETNTHILSPYIYGRKGVGLADRGIGAGPDGKAYIALMYKWGDQALFCFGSDGKPVSGNYVKGKIGIYKSGFPKEFTGATIGPILLTTGGIRVDLKGNIYVGMFLTPKDAVRPKYFEKDEAYKQSVGSILKFPPEGGCIANGYASYAEDRVAHTPGVKGIEMAAGEIAEGALRAYPGAAPFSHGGCFGNSCCTCRVPRFDLDRFGRLAIPNAISNSVQIVDNEGNPILELGAYGNLDSQYVPQDSKDGKPLLSVPEIPMAWPVGVGMSENSIYVCDAYNRRVVRADLTWKAESICNAK